MITTMFGWLAAWAEEVVVAEAGAVKG